MNKRNLIVGCISGVIIYFIGFFVSFLYLNKVSLIVMLSGGGISAISIFLIGNRLKINKRVLGNVCIYCSIFYLLVMLIGIVSLIFIQI